MKPYECTCGADKDICVDCMMAWIESASMNKNRYALLKYDIKDCVQMVLSRWVIADTIEEIISRVGDEHDLMKSLYAIDNSDWRHGDRITVLQSIINGDGYVYYLLRDTLL